MGVEERWSSVWRANKGVFEVWVLNVVRSPGVGLGMTGVVQ